MRIQQTVLSSGHSYENSLGFCCFPSFNLPIVFNTLKTARWSSNLLDCRCVCRNLAAYHNKRRRNKRLRTRNKTTSRSGNFQLGDPRTRRGPMELRLIGRVAVLLSIQLAFFSGLMLPISANSCHFEFSVCCIGTYLADGFPSSPILTFFFFFFKQSQKPLQASFSRVGPSAPQMLVFPSPLSDVILQYTHENREMETRRLWSFFIPSGRSRFDLQRIKARNPRVAV